MLVRCNKSVGIFDKMKGGGWLRWSPWHSETPRRGSFHVAGYGSIARKRTGCGRLCRCAVVPPRNNHQPQTASPILGLYSKTRLPTRMETGWGFRRHLPSYEDIGLHLLILYTCIVYSILVYWFLLHLFAHQFHKFHSYSPTFAALGWILGAFFREGAHAKDSKVASFTAGFMVADGVFSFTDLHESISHRKKIPRFRPVTDIVSWHDLVSYQVVAEHDLFFLFGGRHK